MNKQQYSIIIIIFFVASLNIILVDSQIYAIDETFVPIDCSDIEYDHQRSRAENRIIVFHCLFTNPCPYSPLCTPSYCREEIEYWLRYSPLIKTNFEGFRDNQEAIELSPTCFAR